MVPEGGEQCARMKTGAWRAFRFGFFVLIWEAGMTPVVFVNGKVVAVGWRSMERLGLDSDSSMTIRRR